MSTSDGAVLGAAKIVDNGPANLRFNVVIFSEGYRSSEMAQFAQQFSNTLFATTPYDRVWTDCGCYRPEFNCRMRALGNPFCAVCQKVIVHHLTPFLP